MSDSDLMNTNGDNPDKHNERQHQSRLVSNVRGTRWHTLAALVERIEAAFVAEHIGESGVIDEANTITKRHELIRETADYVLAVESIQVSQQEYNDIINGVFSNLFGYGPLDLLFQDERVTTIALEGADKVSVRYGHDDLTTIDPIFRDAHHLRRIVERMLVDAGAELREDQPFVEVGVVIGKRPICINLLAPPIVYFLTVDMRVHPSAAPTLDALVAQDFMPAPARDVLSAIMQSPHGFIIVGDSESGKTTLLNALSHMLSSASNLVAVERAGELRLPEHIERLVTQWPVGAVIGQTFGEQIGAALDRQPDCLILDEVRSDEHESIAPLLQQPDAPRQIWTFRGPTYAKRLASALGMLARRANMAQSEVMVHALYRRLPFVITVRRSRGRLQLHGISEWQYRESEYPDFVALMENGDDGLLPTGNQPVHSLEIANNFWNLL